MFRHLREYLAVGKIGAKIGAPGGLLLDIVASVGAFSVVGLVASGLGVWALPRHLLLIFAGISTLVAVGASLISMVYEKLTADLRASNQRLRDAFLNTVQALGAALDARDQYTQGHSERVAAYVAGIAGELQVPREEIDTLVRAALLHDIGKVGIPDSILRNPGPLSPQDYAVIQEHPRIGAQILDSVRFLTQEVMIVMHHHERWDGTGYPNRLRGNSIPLGARLIAVADTFDAITSARPYRPARDRHVALQEIARCSGTQFDPTVVQAFLRYMNELEADSDESSQFVG